MANCEHCQKPLPPQPPGRPGPKPRFCDDGCRLAAWLGKAPDQIERISGPWPLPCLVCGCMTLAVTRTVHNREMTITSLCCPCGYTDVWKQPFDDHDLLPFPRPILALELPTGDANYWRTRARQLEVKLNEILALVTIE